jgi:adenylosuccinate synthase
MSLTIVVGGQYGGEGKGLITAHLVSRGVADILIKTGGPNSAHSFGDGRSMFRVRMIPSGSNLGASTIVFPAGCLIHVDTLFKEIVALDYRGRVLVNPNAGIIDSEIVAAQHADSFYEGVGSTMTGTGHASSRRALRRLKLARDEARLARYLQDTNLFVSEALRRGQRVVVEGAQAYGLSNYHGDYPYVSSRDTTTGEVLAQVGLGPQFLDTVILVVKCFPTRNQGGQGPLPHELSTAFLASYPIVFDETGGGSYNTPNRRRRVALFDFEVVKRACIANTPHSIALTGIDRLGSLLHEPLVRRHYGATVDDFVSLVESSCGCKVTIIASGPHVTDVSVRTNAIANEERGDTYTNVNAQKPGL